ncbi:DinB family protein [Nocardioides sp. Root140]|uniref:DinB family protein n=1 Tax=Nocardioides sp. Root140 TaxID=1736460 RepID=UPI0006FEDADA|nr:DinB family protein [Nocardioides sp. Root140]KQY57742.1 hypothetical protein ASD30_13720 [Nocardioides sp. Root140]
MTSFENQDLSGATFHNVDLSRSRLRDVDLTGTVMRGVELVDVDIDGEISDLRINGVDVVPLVEAELDRRHPNRVKMRPTDAAGFREGWDVVQRMWAGTVDRARGLDPDLLHESVDGEWSFIQTLRHLVYATDCWVNRVLLGDPRPFHPLDLPWDGATPHPEVPWDLNVRPSLDEVLAVRAERQATVRRVLDELTDEQLATETTPVDGPGWPPARAFPFAEPLRIVLNEEWQHRLYAERDLDVLQSRG